MCEYGFSTAFCESLSAAWKLTETWTVAANLAMPTWQSQNAHHLQSFQPRSADWISNQQVVGCISFPIQLPCRRFLYAMKLSVIGTSSFCMRSTCHGQWPAVCLGMHAQRTMYSTLHTMTVYTYWWRMYVHKARSRSLPRPRLQFCWRCAHVAVVCVRKRISQLKGEEPSVLLHRFSHHVLGMI